MEENNRKLNQRLERLEDSGNPEDILFHTNCQHIGDGVMFTNHGEIGLGVLP